MKSKVKKSCEIRDAKISFVSLVDKAANKRQFLITKADDGNADWKTVGRIIKADNHYVTGIVYEPLVEDSQGDFMTADEIQKACYWFAKNGDAVDIQHNFEAQSGISVVENWVEKADIEINGEKIAKGSWLLTAEVSDSDIWDKITKGEITGFSMGGTGKYSKEDVDLESIDKSEKQSIISKLAKMLGLGQDSENEPVAKAGKKMSSKNREVLNGIYNSLGEFINRFDEPEDINQNNKEENDMTRSEVEKLISDSIEKALAKSSSESKNDDVQKSADNTAITAEFIEKTVQEAIVKAMTPKEETLTAEQIQKMVSEAVEKAVEPLRKAAGVPTNLNDQQVAKNDERHYLYGIL